MVDEAQFPFNIPLSDLYLVREPTAPASERAKSAARELREAREKSEAQLREKIGELKRELETAKSRAGSAAPSVEEPLAFIPVQEKILAADGSAHQNYLP